MQLRNMKQPQLQPVRNHQQDKQSTGTINDSKCYKVNYYRLALTRNLCELVRFHRSG